MNDRYRSKKVSQRQSSPTFRKSELGRGNAGVFAVLVVAIVFIGILTAWYQLGTVQSVTFTVQDKTIKVTNDGEGNSESKYMIYTSSGVFENTDALFHGKWRSSDIYGQLRRKRQYTCKVYGWRIGFLSMYQNIIKCHSGQ